MSDLVAGVGSVLILVVMVLAAVLGRTEEIRIKTEAENRLQAIEKRLGQLESNKK